MIELKLSLDDKKNLNVSTSWNLDKMTNEEKVLHLNIFAMALAKLQTCELIQHVRYSIGQYAQISKSKDYYILLVDSMEKFLSMQSDGPIEERELSDEPVISPANAFRSPYNFGGEE